MKSQCDNLMFTSFQQRAMSVSDKWDMVWHIPACPDFPCNFCANVILFEDTCIANKSFAQMDRQVHEQPESKVLPVEISKLLVYMC